MSGPRGGGGGERSLSLTYKICKKNKEDWTSVEKGLIFFGKLVFLIEINNGPILSNMYGKRRRSMMTKLPGPAGIND